MTKKSSRHLVFMGLFTALTTIGSLIKIPFFPVPLTMQSFFPLLAGCFFSPLAAATTQGLYLLLGLIGLPVFSQGGGIAYVLKPTFGYLLAMPITAGLVAYLLGRCEGIVSFRHYFMITFVSGLLLLLIGSVWMFAVFNFISVTPLPFSRAIWLGLIVFIPADVVKSAAASFLAIKIKNRIEI